MIKQILFIVLFILSFNSQATDIEKEKRWADQVVDSIVDGDAVWLNDGAHDFLSIYTHAEKKVNRAVIVMHGTGIHPDWQQVVHPLRVGLTEHGWNTLSIQMPVLDNEAEYEEYAPLYDEVAPRINAAIKYLNKNAIKEIVLIGHSQGAAMTAYYLSTNKEHVKGFVSIGMAAFAKDKRMDSILSLQKIKIPVLDLYGSDDLKSILESVSLRSDAAKKAENTNYTQLQIQGNHFYDGEEDALVKVVAEWLNKLK